MSIGYFNGAFYPIEQIVIPIDERGHQFGDGVYEVIRIYEDAFFMLDEHIQRLFKSAKAIKLKINHSENEMKELIKEVVAKSALSNCDVYIQITRGIAPRNHLFPDAPVSVSMTVKPSKVINDSIRQKGKTAIFHEDERWANCHIKSLNLLPNILAKQAAFEAGCYEAILVKDGFVTEGTSSNVYMITDKTITTTPLSKHILAGITRIAVKEVATELGFQFVEKSFTPDELLEADEVFITSTTNEIMPIVSIDGKSIRNSDSKEQTLTVFKQFMKRVKVLQTS
ncbi:D-amino-acid transaminase [Filibacter tadaridae]|uniref:D-alanine aminotransferase n=1 Tax=Filibacter tadaridae TaxID=2483811 RepID=A0A3P5X014_9BACL|nr:D-amino-acid transaminase [Filibacter tadaridae]VDC27584.1 D-alanine aminotransferase [Filibacter tadaridae]